MGTILLYYKYINIQNPQEIANWQRSLCEGLHLTGRIILAHEGINGTLGGTDEECQQYIEAMNAHELFQNIDFKTADGGSESFPKLKISIKNEIVRLGVDPTVVTVKDTGIHLTPDQTHEMLSNRSDDLIVLDTRNDYEWKVGHFAGKNYVFDERITVRANADILSTCLHCDTKSDEYTNCLNAMCNKHYTSCEPCRARLGNSCSENCQMLVAT